MELSKTYIVNGLASSEDKINCAMDDAFFEVMSTLYIPESVLKS